MSTLRTRGDLRSLLERQLASATLLRPGGADEELEGRTALKVYLLEAHGRLRDEPLAALGAIAARTGLDLAPTHDAELVGLAQGDLAFWLDLSRGRRCRLYTNATAREADRVHELLVAATPWLVPAYIAPEDLESLAQRTAGRMVLFSLRHDRRALRREESDAPDAVDLVTLRFWAPSAEETLRKMRASEVLPGATSVASVRVKLGAPEAYALAEGYHHGKFTAVGSSFDELERLLDEVDAASERWAAALGEGPRARRLEVRFPRRFSAEELAFAASRLWSGAEPFALWGVPEGPDARGVFHGPAVDLPYARVARYELGPSSAAVTLPPEAPAGLALRFFAALQYHVHAAAEATPAAAHEHHAGAWPLAFDERAPMQEVARCVLTEAAAQWLRGAASLAAGSVALGTHGPRATSAVADLARRVLSEAAAHEWREWLRPVRDPEGQGTVWRWQGELSLEAGARGRELAKLQRASAALVARVSGGVDGPWSQLSLFDAEALVPPSHG